MEIQRKYLEWFNGMDTGISSKTIMSVILDIPYRGYDHPYDMSDFGRCYRMLKLFPELRKELGKLYSLPFYQPFLDCWPQLERLYNEALSFELKPHEEQAKLKRRKGFVSPYEEFWDLIQKLSFMANYLKGMHPQGSENYWTNKRCTTLF